MDPYQKELNKSILCVTCNTLTVCRVPLMVPVSPIEKHWSITLTFRHFSCVHITPQTSLAYSYGSAHHMLRSIDLQRSQHWQLVPFRPFMTFMRAPADAATWSSLNIWLQACITRRSVINNSYSFSFIILVPRPFSLLETHFFFYFTKKRNS